VSENAPNIEDLHTKFLIDEVAKIKREAEKSLKALNGEFEPQKTSTLI